MENPTDKLITISTDMNTSIKENFENKLQSMELLTRIWSRRNLSIKGKLTIAIINSILIPKLVYPCTILEVPDEVIKSAKELIKSFFWNWKCPKIKMDVLVRKIEKGGIKYPCLKCKAKSWKMLWAIRSLKYEDTDPLWLHIVNSLLPDGITFTCLLKTRPSRKTLDDVCPNLPKIYKEIVLNWEKTAGNVETDRKEKNTQRMLVA